jgi:hypothetical protein
MFQGCLELFVDRMDNFKVYIIELECLNKDMFNEFCGRKQECIMILQLWDTSESSQCSCDRSGCHQGICEMTTITVMNDCIVNIN